MNAIFRRILPILLLALTSSLSGCYLSSRVDYGMVHTTGPFLMEVRQTPDGNLGLIYADSRPTEGNVSAANIHVYQLDPNELSKRIEQVMADPNAFEKTSKWISDEPPQPDVLALKSENGPVFRVSQQLIPGQWLPKLTAPGIKPSEASEKLPGWYASNVTVTNGPGRPLVWNSPNGNRTLIFYDMAWEETHDAAKVLELPARLLDFILLPIEAPIWIMTERID